MSNENSTNPVPLTVEGARPATSPISRREAMQWVLGAIAASSLVRTDAIGQPVGRTPAPQEGAATQPGMLTKGGYGMDLSLVKGYKPGEIWPLTFNDAQKKAATALADTILPKDQYGPAASELGVVEMVDEWVSAPYPQQLADRPIVIEGLAWIDAESNKRFGKSFADTTPEQKHAICDDICYGATAKKEFKAAARSFSKFRSLCAAAYYATPEGWTAIGYVGNVALPSFDGPPPEVLQKLGVEQTVK